MQTTQLNNIPFTVKRWLLLGGTSVVLCLSFILTMFTPYPVALSGILFGRAKGYLLLLISTIIMASLSLLLGRNIFFVALYVVFMLVAAFIMEIVVRQKDPVKAVAIGGSAFIIFVFSAIGITSITGNFNPKTYLVEKIKEQTSNEEIKTQLLNSTDAGAIDLANLLNQPEVLADQILQTLPSYFVIMVFVTLWINLYLSLRSKRLLVGYKNLGEKLISEFSLIRFKVPDYCVWGVIVALGLAVFGGHLGSQYYEVAGITLLSALGVFYFFQGFALFLDFLTIYKIFGFLRFFLVMLSVLLVSWAFALLGLFDGFFNFRKYLNKINK